MATTTQKVPLALKVEAVVAAVFFGFVGWGVYEGLRLDELDMVSAGGLALTAMMIQTVGFVAVGQKWYRSNFAMFISVVFISGSLLAIYHVEREYYLIKMLAGKATNAVALSRTDALGPRLRDAEARVRSVSLYTDNMQEVYQQTRRLAEGEAQGSATGKVGRGKVYLAINQIAANAQTGLETATTMRDRMQKELDEAKKLYTDTRSAITEGRISNAAVYTALGNVEATLGGIFGVSPEVFLPKLVAVRQGFQGLLTEAPSLNVAIQAIQQTEASATAALKPLTALVPPGTDLRQPLPAEAVRLRLAAGDFSAQNWQVTFLLMAVPIGILLFSALHNQDGIRHFWRHGRLNESIDTIQRKADYKKAKTRAKNGGNADRFFTGTAPDTAAEALIEETPQTAATQTSKGPTLRQRAKAFWEGFNASRAARKAQRDTATPTPAVKVAESMTVQQPTTRTTVHADGSRETVTESGITRTRTVTGELPADWAKSPIGPDTLTAPARANGPGLSRDAEDAEVVTAPAAPTLQPLPADAPDSTVLSEANVRYAIQVAQQTKAPPEHLQSLTGLQAAVASHSITLGNVRDTAPDLVPHFKEQPSA